MIAWAGRDGDEALMELSSGWAGSQSSSQAPDCLQRRLQPRHIPESRLAARAVRKGQMHLSSPVAFVKCGGFAHQKGHLHSQNGASRWPRDKAWMIFPQNPSGASGRKTRPGKKQASTPGAPDQCRARPAACAMEEAQRFPGEWLMTKLPCLFSPPVRRSFPG